MFNPNCLFCKIVAKQIPAKIIYEDEHALAFLDIMPRTTGHTLVIPKVHAPNILELPSVPPNDELSPLFAAVKHVAEMLTRALAPDGTTIGANQGRASGQEVDHLHVHLLPRWHGDGGGSIQSVVNAKPKESVDEVAKRILSVV
jgi:histidine triad (HIT) family protein